MNWFLAKIVYRIVCGDGDHTPQFDEQLRLVQATDESSAFEKAKAIATAHNFEIRSGVYLAVTGPTFETKAEYQMILTLGADVVGMSTVQESIVANHAGMHVFAMSVVTDIGIRDDDNIITHEEVLEAARQAEPKLAVIFKELVAAI